MHVSVSMTEKWGAYGSQVSGSLELGYRWFVSHPPEVGTRVVLNPLEEQYNILTTGPPLQLHLHLLLISAWNPWCFKEHFNHCALLTNPKLPPWTRSTPWKPHSWYHRQKQHPTGPERQLSCVRFLVQMSDVRALWDCFLSGNQKSYRSALLWLTETRYGNPGQAVC